MLQSKDYEKVFISSEAGSRITTPTLRRAQTHAPRLSKGLIS